ncbi:unnamed protein product [Calypogeia fissa]
MEWKLFPRNAKVLYIPDPQRQMTPQQLSRYHVGAAAALNPIAIVPPPAAQPPKVHVIVGMNRTTPLIIAFPVQQGLRVPERLFWTFNDADLLLTLAAQAQPSRADVDPNASTYQLRPRSRHSVDKSAIGLTTNVSETSAMGFPRNERPPSASNFITFGDPISSELVREGQHSTTLRRRQISSGADDSFDEMADALFFEQCAEDYDSPEELRRRYEADQRRRVEYSDELTIAYCKAKEKLDTLNVNLNMVVELGEDDAAATTFWASFDAALVARNEF